MLAGSFGIKGMLLKCRVNHRTGWISREVPLPSWSVAARGQNRRTPWRLPPDESIGWCGFPDMERQTGEFMFSKYIQVYSVTDLKLNVFTLDGNPRKNVKVFNS